MTDPAADPMFVVDIHTHYTPPALSRHGTSGAIATEFVDGRPSYTFHPMLHDIEAFVEAKVAADIDISVISSGAGYDAPLDVCKQLNDELASVKALHDQRLECMAHVNPLFGAASLDELERCKELGLRGLAVGSDVSEVPLDDHRYFDAFEWLEDAGQFLFVHPAVCPRGTAHLDRHDMARSIGREFGLIEAIVRLVDGGVFDRFPKLQVVISHLGGGIATMLARIMAFQDRAFWGLDGDPVHGSLPRRPFEDYLSTNLFFDTAGSSADIRSLQAALTWLPRERIVFGTDFPQELRTAEAVRAFASQVAESIGGEAARDVLGGRALGFQPTPTPTPTAGDRT